TSGGTSWSSHFLQPHGGIVGEAVYVPAKHLVSDVGVTILLVCLALGALGLLTGSSLGGAVRALARAFVRALGFIRALGDAPPAREGGEGAVAAGTREVASAAAPISVLGGPPEPHDRALIVRATHVEAPPPDEREQYDAD